MRVRLLFCLAALVAGGFCAGIAGADSAPPPSPSGPEDAVVARPADAHRERARHLLNIHRPQAALEILKTLPHEWSGDIDLTFMYGLASLLTAVPLPPGEQKQALLDEAISSFHDILIAVPQASRVRLEQARAFFEKGEDSLSEQNFRRVLADELPPIVIARVQAFLDTIHQRRRWRGGASFALAPDSNINTATSAQQITIFGLPFRLDDDARAKSGIGVTMSGNVEYHAPPPGEWLGARKWRIGGSVSRRDYPARRFDDTLAAIHTGPQFAVAGADVSLLASANQRWIGIHRYSTDRGGRLEVSRPIGRHWQAGFNAAWHKRYHRTAEDLDGPRLDARLSLVHTLTSTIRLRANAGWDRERPRTPSLRNTTRWIGAGADFLLPRGFTIGGYLRFGETRYQGRNVFSASPDNRHDRESQQILTVNNRAITILGFSPSLSVIFERNRSNAPLSQYKRTRAEIGFVRQF